MGKIDLNTAKVAAPCPASWADMKGDDRLRQCADCKLKVYNVAEMTKEESETMIAESEGRLCMRLYRRPDGTILTKDCSVGVWRRRRRRIGIAAAVTLLFGGTAAVAASDEGGGAARSIPGTKPAAETHGLCRSQVWY